ncbi:hypothetical protein [Mycobacteroides abscessus]|uniref:hypothetical protein n=1 Tax=Mycobacteroides abscessus TaxID=36809 RepID=UPI000E685BE5|nr:hypothetical protein [Mycobacteroides abscessus]RIS80454.1 hypothetical protein D2E44_18985 [Mycobacteroides abscessus]
MTADSTDPDDAAHAADAEADVEAQAQVAVRTVARWLLDITDLCPELTAIMLRYAAIYTRSRVRLADVRRRHYSVWLDLLEGELIADPQGSEAQERITPAAREKLRRLIDHSWIVIMSSASEKHRALTAEAARRAARELACDRGFDLAVALYCGAVAEAIVRGIDVAELVVGDPMLVEARAETESVKPGNVGVCECWIRRPDVWAEISERATVLLRVNEIGTQ